ncbi:phosphopantetheine-binding protein [Actinomyces sp. F1_1611]
MGSIADLLGGELPDEWEQSDRVARQEGAREVALEAILTETNYPPEQMSPGLRLREELELDGLPLWAVVAQIERELKVTIPDREVKSWVTLADLLDAVERAG